MAIFVVLFFLLRDSCFLNHRVLYKGLPLVLDHLAARAYSARLLVLLVIQVLQEGRVQKCSCRGSLTLILLYADVDEVGYFRVKNTFERPWWDPLHNFVVDLGYVQALVIRSLLRNHLKYAHAEGIDVNTYPVVLGI